MASLEAGRRLADRFVLTERLGDGGHAEVWSALDQRTGGCVALKFLHLRSCTAAEAMPVLRHEAAMARRLDHAGVLRVEEPQRDGDYVFLPVEYVPGGSAARLRGAPWRQSLPALLDVARVLEHAHGRGVIHRDVKPGNVLFDAAGRVRVSDFGTSARIGSCDAPAAGSPFSASPQQLRGEAASASDDVYGLGALTYELLTRYPPFYPHFDAQRVQSEDPPAPSPVHCAPPALVALVQTMLARDAAARPALPEVITQFEGLLATPPAADEDVLLITATAARNTLPRTQRAPRRVPVGWWLGAAAVAAAAVLLMLPKPQSGPRLVPEAQRQQGPVTRVADAIVTGTTRPPASATPAEVAAPLIEAPAAVTVDEELATGQRALDAWQSAQARAAFQRALALQPAHQGALEGVAAAARLERQLADLATGMRDEAAGDLDEARERYLLLLANQPGFTPARSALARVDARLAEQQFERALADAAAALQTGHVDEADAAYASAAQLRPGDARVLDGQQRVAEIRRDRRNAQDLAAGTQLESAEQWDQAVAHYRAVLEREADLLFAQDGLARSERRAALDAELADYLARPERLTSAAVRQAAQRALARGQSTASNAPRLTTQLAQLRVSLDTLAEPVSLELNSDNSTMVSVTRIGELGAFETRALNLPPGRYTVVGRRDGFRDVRFELDLAPGQPQTVLSVRCTERI